MALSKSEQTAWLGQEPKFDDIIQSVTAASKMPKGLIRETQEVAALARKFNHEVVKPMRLELDRKVQENPDYLPHELVKKANEWGLFTLWIPKAFGGKGYNMPSFSFFAEEISSCCTAVANLIGVHYLGVATLMATWNAPVIFRVLNDVLDGEKTGRPCLISLALTEPAAGTDIEDVDLMDKGTISCHAQRVDGGYNVNGEKVFISNGHLSTWHMLFSFAHLEKPSENLVMLAVKTGMKGFSFGRMERKMGQKSCPASELVFRDCHVPDELVCLCPEDAEKLEKGPRKTAMQLIDYIFSASRAAVCAFGAGVARGAYQEALEFASRTNVCGKPLINHEWAQSMLAQMYGNVAVARLAYVESNHANSLRGMYKWLQFKPFFYFLKWMPQKLSRTFIHYLLNRPLGTWMLRKAHCDFQTQDDIDQTSGWASLAKFTGADMGVKNAQMALELMGQAGLRHDHVVEKHLRDARLIQIYEGTNQLNRLNLFKCLIAPSLPPAKMFDE